ncbi:MAG: sulfotransferase family protein [Planctomycetes bacterium]|nr:sulfotransferase family protein [Planctomycetota bacterium]
MDRNFVAIVSGLPRSGTSMMMRMIDAGGIPALIDNTRKPDEDNPRGYYEFEAVKRTKQDPSWLAQAGGKVVKMVHLLLLDLPKDRGYRVIFMRRRLEEVVKSQNVMLERKGKSSQGLRDDQVMNMFRQQIQQVDQYLKSSPCFKVLYVNYNELLGDPRPWLSTLDEFLGGEMQTDKMLEMVDPSLYRQRAS